MIPQPLILFSELIIILFSSRRKMQWDVVEFLNKAIHWWITQLVSVTLTQDWIVIYPVDRSVQLTCIWDLMGKFIPHLNFMPTVTQHMPWHARCITQFTQKWQCLCYFLWKPCLYWNSNLFFVCVFCFCLFFSSETIAAVYEHTKRTREIPFADWA